MVVVKDDYSAESGHQLGRLVAKAESYAVQHIVAAAVGNQAVAYSVEVDNSAAVGGDAFVVVDFAVDTERKENQNSN
jgi:hypothetical protein